MTSETAGAGSRIRVDRQGDRLVVTITRRHDRVFGLSAREAAVPEVAETAQQPAGRNI